MSYKTIGLMVAIYVLPLKSDSHLHGSQGALATYSVPR